MGPHKKEMLEEGYNLYALGKNEAPGKIGRERQKALL